MIYEKIAGGVGRWVDRWTNGLDDGQGNGWTDGWVGWEEKRIARYLENEIRTRHRGTWRMRSVQDTEALGE